MKQTSILTRQSAPSDSVGGSTSEQELYDLCAIGDNTHLSHKSYVSQECSASKPFAWFGSYRHLHGDSDHSNGRSSHGPNRRFSSEAPAKLGGGCSYGGPAVTTPSQNQHLSKSDQKTHHSSWEATLAMDIITQPAASRSKETSCRQRLRKQKSWGRETDREKAWERRKDLHSVDALLQSSPLQNSTGKIGRSISDCSCHRMGVSQERLWGRRRRSLTDEDLEELRGCIDLGFGFSNQADDPKLWKTLPALELCYAISQQFKDQIKGHPSPVSILDHEDFDGSTIANKPMAGSWKISSPGDHPQVIKERLRHWAQAVAFTIREKL